MFDQIRELPITMCLTQRNLGLKSAVQMSQYVHVCM